METITSINISQILSNYQNIVTTHIQKAYRLFKTNYIEQNYDAPVNGYLNWLKNNNDIWSIFRSLLLIVEYISIERDIYLHLDNKKNNSVSLKEEVTLLQDELIEFLDSQGINLKQILSNKIIPCIDVIKYYKFVEQNKSDIYACEAWHLKHLWAIIDKCEKYIENSIVENLKSRVRITHDYLLEIIINRENMNQTVNLDTKVDVAIQMLTRIKEHNIQEKFLDEVFSDKYGNLKTQVEDLLIDIENEADSLKELKDASTIELIASEQKRAISKKLRKHLVHFENLYIDEVGGIYQEMKTSQVENESKFYDFINKLGGIALSKGTDYLFEKLIGIFTKN